MTPALRFRTLMILSTAAAALASASVFGATAHAQVRTLDSGAAMSLVVGSPPERQCYDAARDRVRSNSALRVCNQALRRALTQANRTATYVNRAIILEARGEYDEALSSLDEALKRRPDLAAAFMNQGSVLTRLERWSSAEAAFDRAIELGAPAPHRAYFARGLVREEREDFEGAFADFTTASQLAPAWNAPRRELERYRLEEPSAKGGV